METGSVNGIHPEPRWVQGCEPNAVHTSPSRTRTYNLAVNRENLEIFTPEYKCLYFPRLHHISLSGSVLYKLCLYLLVLPVSSYFGLIPITLGHSA